MILVFVASCSAPIKSKTRVYDRNNHMLPMYDKIEYEDGRVRVFDLNNHYQPLYDEKSIPCFECPSKDKER